MQRVILLRCRNYVTRSYRPPTAFPMHVKGGTLTDRLYDEVVDKYRIHMKQTKEKYEGSSLGEYNVGQCIGGMRGMKALLYEPSLLDEQEGIRYRGYSIPQIQKLLPKAKNGQQPLPEALLWLLLANEIPSEDQVWWLSRELHARAVLPPAARILLYTLPTNMHPMTQLAIGVLACQTESKFAEAYTRGMHKLDHWKYMYEDTLDLIARLPEIASIIYRRTFHPAKPILEPDYSLDYASNFSHMLGFDNPSFYELMRLYLVAHADHEGGNVSAHTTQLVGSTLADPYLSFASGMCGLAGPLHGLASQEFQKQFLGKYTLEELGAAIEKTLASGQVVPGFGHAVLKRVDPRYVALQQFGYQHLPDDDLFQLANNLFKVVPPILSKKAKIKNPWPNVDAMSGVMLHHFGLYEAEYYTVLFGVARAIGVLSSSVISRIYGLPIERPKSITTEWIIKNLKSKQP